MAQEVQITLVDDIDGGRAVETVRFSLDGISYEIDLSARNAKRLRTNLEQFVRAGRRVRYTRSRHTRTGAAQTADRVRNKAIRAWAKRKRIQLSDRGRIPSSVIERYEAAGGR